MLTRSTTVPQIGLSTGHLSRPHVTNQSPPAKPTSQPKIRSAASLSSWSCKPPLHPLRTLHWSTSMIPTLASISRQQTRCFRGSREGSGLFKSCCFPPEIFSCFLPFSSPQLSYQHQLLSLLPGLPTLLAGPPNSRHYRNSRQALASPGEEKVRTASRIGISAV